MKTRCKVIEFKSISPFFEMERDGVKPFTIRQIDYKDRRFRALAQWQGPHPHQPWLIKSTNPATGEYFYRKLIGKRYFPGGGPPCHSNLNDWLILYIGEEVEPETSENRQVR